MGIVYEALDGKSGERVAVKTVRVPGGEAIGRLKREFRALQDLDHDNLVHLGELIEDKGAWFFTMELVDGIDLLEWVRPGLSRPRLGATHTQAAAPGGRRRESSERRALAPALQADGFLDEARLRDALAQ